MPSLRITSADGHTRNVSVLSGMTLGRSLECDVDLLDPAVSRRHAEVTQQGDKWVIRDLHTSNGTFVGGERASEAVLKEGTEIKIGAYRLVFAERMPDDARLQSTTTAADFRPASVRAALGVESQTSSAVVAAHLDPTKTARDIEVIERMSRLIHTAQNPSALCNSLTQELLDLYHACDACHVLMWDAEGEQLRPGASQCRGEPDDSAPQFSMTVVERALKEKQALLCSSVDADPSLAAAHSVTALRIGAFVCVPLLQNGDPMGLIYLHSLRSGSPFTEADLRVLSVIGNETALALRNMELLNHYVDKQRMETALDLAGDIQRRVLPERPPCLPGFDIAARCIPCDSTSGDYYDFIELNDGRWCLAVGDVSGHGFAPALLMMEARSLVRALAVAQRDLQQLLSDANRLLANDLRDDMWMSMMLLVLEPETSTIDYVSAGHEPAVVFRSASRQAQYLDATTHPMGVVPEFEFTSSERPVMDQGDVLFMCTDGVVETLNAQNQLFGRERLQAVIAETADQPPEAILEAVLSQVEQFRGGAPQHDDLTIVVVKRE